MQTVRPLITRHGVTRALMGLRDAFFQWSPLPEPAIRWERVQGRPEPWRRWLRSDVASWILVLVVFVAVAWFFIDYGGWAILVAVLTVFPFMVGRENVLAGWRVGFLLALAVLIGWTQIPDLAVVTAVGLIGLTVAVGLTHERAIALWVWVPTVAVVTALTGGSWAVASIIALVGALVVDTIVSRRTWAAPGPVWEPPVSEPAQDRGPPTLELRDDLAHLVSLVLIRAESAPQRLRRLGANTRAEFAVIADAARDTVHRIHELLPRDTPVDPPSLWQLENLIENVRKAGGKVAFTVVRDRRSLSSEVEVAAYRILQEALTNAACHAPGEDAEVWIEYGEDDLTVVVANSCPDPAGKSGRGITGMRARAASVGGRVSTGRRSDGRFVVEAMLPIDD